MSKTPDMNSLSIETCNVLFDNCPTATAIFNYKNLTLEHANPSMLKIWGKDKSVIGLPLLDFSPELESQGYPDLLKIVGDSDIPYSEQGAKVEIIKDGKLVPIYVDFNYTPIRVVNRISAGILVTATEVSEKQLNMLSGDEYQRNLRSMVLSSPVAMCVFRGYKMNLEVVNAHMLNLWQREECMNLRLMRHVFHTGHPIQYVEKGISYSCTPLRNEQGSSVGCVLIAVQE